MQRTGAVIRDPNEVVAPPQNRRNVQPAPGTVIRDPDELVVTPRPRPVAVTPAPQPAEQVPLAAAPAVYGESLEAPNEELPEDTAEGKANAETVDAFGA